MITILDSSNNYLGITGKMTFQSKLCYVGVLISNQSCRQIKCKQSVQRQRSETKQTKEREREKRIERIERIEFGKIMNHLCRI